MRWVFIVPLCSMAALVATALPSVSRPAIVSALERSDEQAGEGLRIVGSQSMDLPAQEWAREFAGQFAGVRVNLTMSGSGMAAGALANGSADIAALARELSPDELRFVNQEGIQLQAIRIGSGSYTDRALATPVIVFVNASNPLERLGLHQLKAVLSAETQLPKWSDWVGHGATVPRCKVRPYAVSWTNGTDDFLRAKVLRDSPMREIEEVSVGSLEARNLMTSVCGLGFASPGDVPAHSKVLAIGSEGHFTLPSPATNADGTYPLTRSIYLYKRVAQSPFKRLLVTKFLGTALGQSGQQALKRASFEPLLPVVVEAELVGTTSKSL